MAVRKFLDDSGAAQLNAILAAKFDEMEDQIDTRQKKITYSTTDLTPGTSALNTGEIYVVYE